MKPVAFDYIRPQSLAEACALLAAGDEARLIAGGQTLMPLLAMRLARPARLIDIYRLPELAGIGEDGEAVVIGAMTRQADAEGNFLIASKLPLLAKALPFVGHQATRNRGTVGGSIAHADPAAEIPLIAVTLDAEIAVQSAAGPGVLRAQDFFVGPMETALAADTCITGVRFPVWQQPRVGTGFHEVSARRSDFALAAAAAQVALDAEGRCIACAIGLGGVADRPVRLSGAGNALVGTVLDDNEIEAAMRGDVAAIEAMSDLHASAEYRRRVAIALACRALRDAKAEAVGQRP